MQGILQGKYKNFETEELVILYQQTYNEDTLAEIMRRNKPLIALWGSEYTLVGYDTEDKIQEGYFALLKAVNAYKGEQGVQFNSYLKACVKQRYNRIYNELTRKKRSGVALVSWEELEEIHREKAVEFELLSDLAVEEFISSLEGTVHDIALSLLNGYSKSDIARRLSIKPASVTYHCRRLESLAINYFSVGGSEGLIQAI